MEEKIKIINLRIVKGKSKRSTELKQKSNSYKWK